MKKFRKLIPALCMLLVSALFVGTSTYAWFSMNKEVSATNMSVTAKADTPFLQIRAKGGSGDWATTATLTASGTELSLIHPTTIKQGAMVWEYATSKNPADAEVDNTTVVKTLTGTASETGATVLANDGVNYVLQQDIKVRLVDNGNSGTNLKVKNVTFAKGENTIAASGRLLVVSNEGYQLFKLVNGEVTTTETGSANALIAAPVAGTEYTLNAYFFFDGTDASAYTNNATNLSAVTAGITFSID
ncbi:MAG: hypothetical protein EGQ48_03090 [Clostridiales bacterium]|nr:hypothetical protein [Clostridiales bacterium]